MVLVPLTQGIVSKLNSEMYNHEGDSIKNNKQNESDKTRNKNVLGFSPKCIRDMQLQSPPFDAWKGFTWN